MNPFRSPGTWASLLLLAASWAPRAAAENPHISPLSIAVKGNEVFLTFTLNGALDPQLSRRLESGLELSIDYDIRLLDRNRYWFDQFLDAHRFRIAATYNPVRREYLVRDSWDGKPSGAFTTQEFTEAARMLVSRSGLPGFRVRRDWPHKHLYVKMRASYDAGRFFALAPVDSSTEWKKSKTFKIHDADLR
ncbi:MAG: DUF4390 domain-containing protein [Thermoanaerobaculia bacterium]